MSQIFKVDSRQIVPGDIFVAIKGSNTDGHQYIAQAAARGAQAAILSDEYFAAHRDASTALGIALFPVKDPEKSTAALASAWLNRVAPQVVGITGSVGKTTTREVLYAVLRDRFSTHTAVKSYNTLIGCAMTVLAMPVETEILILELGTNHPGEIEEMVRYFPVTHGAITEVAPAHLEGLGSIQGVLAAKMEILLSPKLKFMSYNFDNDILSSAIALRIAKGNEGVKAIGVGGAGADIAAALIRQRLDAALRPEISFKLFADNKETELSAQIFGRQHAGNISFAYALAREFGLNPDEFAQSLRAFSPPNGRGGILRGRNDCILIDETYNASPNAVGGAIKNLFDLETTGNYRKIAVLGGMRELGADAAKWHEIIMSRAALLDDVYLIGEEWRGIDTQQSALRGKWPDVGAFAADFDFGGVERAIVLLKGSRYYELEKLLDMFAENSHAD